MDPQGLKAREPSSIPYPHHHHNYHHHHHHHHHHCRHHHQLFLCPHHHNHHHHHHHHCHRQIRPIFAHIPLNPNSAPSPAFFPQDSNEGASGFGEPSDSAVAQVLQEHEYYGIEEEEEDEEPIFVLTNEWRDFFAKSEAKRKLEKKKAKKGKK